jgi:hypothetical protein
MTNNLKSNLVLSFVEEISLFRCLTINQKKEKEKKGLMALKSKFFLFYLSHRHDILSRGTHWKVR